MRQAILSLLIASLFALPVQAGESENQLQLRDVAQQAVLNSPEVKAKWFEYRAAAEEIDVARGGYLPRLDLNASTGRESLKAPGSNRSSYSSNAYGLTLTQMLFDGFATRSEVARMNKARLVRYYELLETSENAALEAARAYLDVLRYRQLLTLAEDNYVRHKATHEQIKARTAAGVGRRVDLEQAGSRLALAEINLSTEQANLHDVSARYQRLTGSPPPSGISDDDNAPVLPDSIDNALQQLYARHPGLLAAIENIEAAQYDIDARRASHLPRVDLRLRSERTSNYQGGSSERDNQVAEVVMNWNLFNGGSDRARERQFGERKQGAIEMREKVCRDTRQTLLIAYNDVLRLREQQVHLNTQVTLLEATRNAYRSQFDVGQRTLLDLLDTENELLSARRAAVNANHDLRLANLRTQAAMGNLLEHLGLQKLDTHTPATADLASVDAASLCPPTPIALTTSDRQALDARALAPSRPHTPPPAAVPAGTAIESQVRNWVASWAARDFPAYLAFYAPSFTPDGGLSREDWATLRRNRILPRGTITIEIEALNIRQTGDDQAVVQFEQQYRSREYADRVIKTLEMIRLDGKWLINREHSRPCAGNTVGGCRVTGGI